MKRRLQQALEWPVKHAAAFKRLGLQMPRGVLLHGPPGEHLAWPPYSNFLLSLFICAAGGKPWQVHVVLCA